MLHDSRPYFSTSIMYLMNILKCVILIFTSCLLKIFRSLLTVYPAKTILTMPESDPPFAFTSKEHRLVHNLNLSICMINSLLVVFFVMGIIFVLLVLIFNPDFSLSSASTYSSSNILSKQSTFRDRWHLNIQCLLCCFTCCSFLNCIFFLDIL